MQTTVQKEESVRLGNGILKINDINIGALKGAGIEVEQITAQLKFSNAKLKPRSKIKDVKFKATMVEINLDNLKKIFGGELSTVTADTSTTGNERKVLTYDDFLRVIETYPLVFENTDSKGKKFGVKIFQAYATNSINFTFPDDEDLEATIELPIEFGAYPNDDNKYFEIFDEQAI